MLETRNLDCIRGQRKLFSRINIRLGKSEMLHVQGTNGSGKTTLLRMLCGLTPADAGEIFWRGQLTAKLGEDFRRELYYFGHPNAIKEELTPLENLVASARLADETLSIEAARDALDRIGLAGKADLPCRFLSQGQKRRVALARLVNERRPLWILDEPYVALDPAAIALVAGLIAAHLEREGLVVLTTHQSVKVEGAKLREVSLTSASTPC